jgi:CheY-like chemotaxis protein
MAAVPSHQAHTTDTMLNSQNATGDTAGDAVDKAKVLVVDDRPENLLVTKTVLDELGHQVITATSGEEALKCLLEHDFAVILLDVNMPGMDGLETASFIRKRRRTHHTPIIFLTAYVEEMHTSKGYSLGAVDYMLTPVMPDILRTKVSVFVQLDLMTRQARRQADQKIALAQEQAARAAAEQAKRRSAFLADASDILGNSLDPGATAKALAPFLLPALGDVIALVLIDERGITSQAEFAWVAPAGGGAVRSESVSEILDSSISRILHTALASGAVVSELDAGPVALAVAPLEAGGNASIDLGYKLCRLAVLPLVARGRKLGALVLGIGPSGRNLDTYTMALAEDLAARAAIALDNCLLYAKIQEEDRRKNEFLAMLAHELRNPLAPIRNAVQILRLPGQVETKIDWARDVIDRQTQQLVRLVDDLLDVARITQGSIALKLEAVNVAAVMRVAEEMARPLIDARRHELTMETPTRPLSVHGDYSRIAQILANLLNNAAKYTDPGGRISFSAEEQGAEVVFRVRDSGMGIPKELLGSIFELFTQANCSLDRSQGGLGIGLTVARRLVEMQGGSVHANSAGLGKGSEFTVRLRRVAHAAAPVAANTPPRNGGQHRILIVDDYADAAESMAALLKIEGHEINTAHDGEAAIMLAHRFKPDIIFLDIGLPGMSGYEVARALRDTPETRDCVLIALSGYGQPGDHVRSKEAGFDRHLVKPVDMSNLQEILDSLKQPSARTAVA